MTLHAIKVAIEDLAPDEKTALLRWLSEQERKAWDAQIEGDFSPGGAGMALLEDVDRKIDHGHLEDFKVTRPRERAR